MIGIRRVLPSSATASAGSRFGTRTGYALLFLVPTAVLFLVLIGYPLVYSLVLMF